MKRRAKKSGVRGLYILGLGSRQAGRQAGPSNSIFVKISMVQAFGTEILNSVETNPTPKI